MFYNYHNHNMMEELMHTLTAALTYMVIFIIACILVYLVVKQYVRFFSGMHKLGVKTAFRNPSGIPLGRHGMRYVYIPAASEGHICVISTTGGGKTHKFLTHVIDAWVTEKDMTTGKVKHTGFYIDISGDIHTSVDIRDPSVKIFELLDPESFVYDVFGEMRLMEGRNAQLDALGALAFLLIPKAASQDSAAYYEKTGRDFLNALLITLYFKGYSFLEICRKVCSSTAKELLEEIVVSGDPDAMAKVVKFDDLKGSQMSNIYDAAHDALEIFASPAVSSAFDTSRTDCEILCSANIEEDNIFFVIPDNRRDQYAQILRLVTVQILDHISARPPYSGTKILLAIDEFGSFGEIDIQGPLEKYRKRNCRIILLFQDIQQLVRNMSEEEKETVFGNIAYTICLGTPGPRTQIFLADLIGKRLMLRKSYSMGSGLTISEFEGYPVMPYKFGRCRNFLYVIHNNEFMRLRKMKYK